MQEKAIKQMSSSMAKVSLFGFYNYELLENESMLQIAVLFLLFFLLIPLKFYCVLFSSSKKKKKAAKKKIWLLCFLRKKIVFWQATLVLDSFTEFKNLPA